MADNQMRLQFASLSQNEGFARSCAAAFATQMNPTIEELSDIRTAVSEAVTNAVIHGYNGGEGIISIELEADVESRRLYIWVRDTGRGIADVKKAMEPMFTTDPSGERSGMGFSFMEAFMDRLEVESALGEGTQVMMEKRIGR